MTNYVPLYLLLFRYDMYWPREPYTSFKGFEFRIATFGIYTSVSCYVKAS